MSRSTRIWKWLALGISPWAIFLLVQGSVLPLQGLEEAPAPPATDELNWSKEREFWAFRSPMRHKQPAVKNKGWPRQPLDYFVLARLEAKQLSPSPQASKRMLIRRLAFDLTGLPPAPEDVEAFVADKRAEAYSSLVEVMLSSPQFGERMASMWLPLVRYAEDQAHQVGSDTKFFYPNAWRYREWVISAFNSDLPYNRFLELQLAADHLEGTNSSNLAALGFLGLGPKYYNRDRLEVQADEWEDRVDTVTRTMLGLNVACARCHDHKFEPITTRDYYALAGVFASTRMVNQKPDGTEEKLDKQHTNLTSTTLHIVTDSDSAQDLPVFRRGKVDSKGPVVERRFLRVLSDGEPSAFKNGSGRKDLAADITDGRNPLTARVMVNRVWGQFFGKPLVATPSNFGHSGQLPTHPELLDDLAARFTERGWSVKALVREIVLSSTYRQSTQEAGPPAGDRENKQALARRNGAAIDPQNELLWRMNRRRLAIEQWRDAVLSVSGELKPGGGKSLELDDPTNHHRTVYARISRLKLNDLLTQFDYPDANVHAEKRSVTTTAIQKLFMLNSPFMLERAKALASRLAAEPNDETQARVKQAYRLLFGRDPQPEELKLGLDFTSKPISGELTRWEQYAHLLLASNEMLYVD